jgi:hypothetical protein
MSFKEAVDLSENIKDFPGILSIVLFGSLARGEVRPDSKIDMAIIYSKKDREIIKWIRYLATDRFNLHHLTLEDLKGKPRIIGALSGEGILLYGNPLNLTLDDLELKSKMIISYDTSRMDQNHRNRLNRALYGGISTYLKGKERKRKEYPGLVEEIDAQKIGKGVLIIERRNAPEITQTFQRFQAKWKEIPIWVY